MADDTKKDDKKKDFKDTVKGKHKAPGASTQTHMKISEIHDNTIVLKNGGLRTVLKTSSINLHLKSEPEQNSIIFSYQNFLNSLEFPIQIVVRSKKIDLDNYIAKLEGIRDNQKNKLLRTQTAEYIEYIKKLIEYADIMEKDFYVIIPQDPFRMQKPGFLRSFMENINPKDSVAKIKQRRAEFNSLKKLLNQRVNVVKSGLESCGLHVEELNTQELIELFYEVYNPLTSRNQKVTEVDKINAKLDPNAKESPETAKRK